MILKLRWLARGLFLLYILCGCSLLLGWEGALLGGLYAIVFVVSCRTVTLLRGLAIFTALLALLMLCFQFFVLYFFGLALGVFGLLWWQMQPQTLSVSSIPEVEYGV